MLNFDGSPDTLVMFAGDWEQNDKYVRKVLLRASQKGCKYVIATGDVGICALSNFLEFLYYESLRFGLTIIMVDGNHDDLMFIKSAPLEEDGYRLLMPNIYYIERGTVFSIGDAIFLGVGGAYTIHRNNTQMYLEYNQEPYIKYRDWLDEETISDEEFNLSLLAGKVDVVITHDAPIQDKVPFIKDSFISEEDSLKSFEHSQKIGKIMMATQPNYLFHSHYDVFYEYTYIHDNNGQTFITGLNSHNSHHKEHFKIMSVHDLVKKVN